jgi:hypothetical protein
VGVVVGRSLLAAALAGALTVGGAVFVAPGAWAALPSECTQTGRTVTCTYGPGNHTFPAPPAGVTEVTVRVLGASGGASSEFRSTSGAAGGAGAVVTGTIPASALQLQVGSRGADAPPGSANSAVSSEPGAGGTTGYGPGGSGGTGVSNGGGGGGGGGSAVLTASGTPEAVAGGGGGGGGSGRGDQGGDGGAGNQPGEIGTNTNGPAAGAGGAPGAAPSPAGGDGAVTQPDGPDGGTVYGGGGGGGGGLRGGTAGQTERGPGGGGGGGSNLVPANGTQAASTPGDGPDGSITITYTAPPAATAVTVKGAGTLTATDGQRYSISVNASSTAAGQASGKFAIAGGGADTTASSRSITSVQKTATGATVTGTATTSRGQTVAFTVTVVDKPGGRDQVTVRLGGRTVTGTLTNGDITTS